MDLILAALLEGRDSILINFDGGTGLALSGPHFLMRTETKPETKV